jgi:hypothetical protein
MKTFFLLLLLSFGIIFNGLSQEVRTKEEIKLERKNKRIAKRFVHPKCVFFNIGLGVFLNHIKMSEENDYFHRRAKELTPMFFLELEIGHKNDFFYETGLTYSNYHYSYRSRTGYGINFYNGQNFEALKLFCGYGKRLILKNSNINIINVSAGVSLSYNLRKKRYSNLGEGYGRQPDIRFVLRDKYPTSKYRLFPTVYLGLNKDIRIYKRTYLSLDYKFDIGFISAFEQEFEYYRVNNPDEITKLTNKIKGTGQSFTIGIKTRFLADKYK